MSTVQRFKRDNLQVKDKWSITPIVNKTEMYVLKSGDREVLLKFNNPHRLQYYLLKDNHEKYALTCNECDRHTVSKILNDWERGIVWVHMDNKLKV